ncbi:MAG: DUF3793 family protein [Peptococcaceae bacterium]|nr:DUF3793 family protein [Peptococcaceae bacterium]
MNKKFLRNYIEYCKNLDDYNYLLQRIAFQTAPTVLGIKPACLVSIGNSTRNLPNIWDIWKTDICGRLKLDFLEMKRSPRRILVLFYREDVLAQHLALMENKKFLWKLGYGDDLKNMLYLLKAKFKSGCPHEVGIFLGFPWQDVKAFMECREKGFQSQLSPQDEQSPKVLLCGYWKVFHNPDLALKIFHHYDVARLMVIGAILDPDLVLKVLACPSVAEL